MDQTVPFSLEWKILVQLQNPIILFRHEKNFKGNCIHQCGIQSFYKIMDLCPHRVFCSF